MKVFTILVVTFLATGLMFAQGTMDFNVNMKVKALEGLFNPSEDSVYVLGSFNDWGNTMPKTTLLDLDNDTIYTAQVSFATTPEAIFFKYRFRDSSATTDVWEGSFPTGSTNREFTVNAGANTSTVYFNNDELVSVPVNVEFRANMKIKALKGQFNPAEDYVLVRGSMNGWGESDTLKDGDNDSIYTKTLSLMSNDMASFKFFYRDVSASADNWENDPNRTYTPPASPSSYEDFFNKDSFYVPQYPVEVFFSVNMELERLSGRFTPGDDTVSVNGNFNGWTAMATILNPNPLNPDLYEGSYNLTAGIGDQLFFKFWYQENNWENNQPTPSNNREYTITADDATNGYATIEAAFNNGSLETVTNQVAVIKFTVFTGGAVSSVSSNPFPVVNTVHLAGSALPLQWPNGGWPDADSTRMIKMYDDGTNGDVTSGDGVFSRDVILPRYTSLYAEYKYGINYGDIVNNEGGNDNENGFGDNHELSLAKFMNGIVTNDTFGIMGTTKLYSNTASTIYEGAWNLVSVPYFVSDFSKTGLYPNASSAAYIYDNGYAQKTSLQNGYGYWVKFPAEDTTDYSGNTILSAAFAVKQGWNIIGSLSGDAAVANITSDPPSIVTSQFFGYSNGYSPATTLFAGKGYWVKVNATGTLYVSTTPSGLPGQIRIVPTSEMPPAPPQVSEENAKPAVFALSQNYPNPFNPVTNISYSLPSDEFVTLKVYNLLGQEVATLINSVQTAGVKNVAFDATNLPSGIYFYKINAGSFSDLKKMIIMK